DDLAAVPIKAVVEHSGVDPATIDDVILGCANQAGEDNRNVARMALLLAGLPVEVPGQTVNRLCGSGLQAVASEIGRAAGRGDWSSDVCSSDLMIWRQCLSKQWWNTPASIPQRSTTSSSAARTRPARTIATSPAWRCSLRDCRSKCPDRP